uniref:Uncharacterized protein n=1 Tax=Glossina palpalis gambiensis TaxID=67801 RepID=A0A1B0AZ19_9MUSC
MSNKPRLYRIKLIVAVNLSFVHLIQRDGTNTCKYLNWRAAGESPITSDASLRAREAFCSPSAAITLALASRAASASAAMARCNCTARYGLDWYKICKTNGNSIDTPWHLPWCLDKIRQRNSNFIIRNPRTESARKGTSN